MSNDLLLICLNDALKDYITKTYDLKPGSDCEFGLVIRFKISKNGNPMLQLPYCEFIEKESGD